MKDTSFNVHIRGECGGSVDCHVTEKPDRSVWYEVVVRVPGHPGWRIDLSKAVSVENLLNAVIQFIDPRPDSDRVLYPVTVSNSFPSEGKETLVKVATTGELDEVLRIIFEQLVW